MQPLDAEIQLLGTETLSAEDLKVELGATDDFKRLQIAWESLPVQLRFTPEKKGKQWFIHVTSKEPVEQPYLEFPLSVKQGKVRLIKGITLLLDPSDFATPHAAPPGRAKKVTASPASATEAPLVDSSGRKIAPPIRAYKVKPGETLWPIAYYLRSDEVTSQQMMIALQRMNPDAFEDGNINKLKAGAVLVVPTTEQVKRINREEALKAFARQEKAWKSGEQLPTDAQPSAPSHSAEIPEKTTADTARGDLPVVEPAVEATMVPHDDKGRLEVLPPSRPGENPQQEEPLQQEILRQEETASSEQVTQSNLLQELRLLRVQVREMQELLKFKDQQIATLQSIIDAQRLASVQPPVTATVQGRAGSMSASPRTETNTDLLDPVAAGNTPLPPPSPPKRQT
ncbi:hypothetical protein EBS_0498 [endosymbiont of unidentified scaly snail isolate Monju]|uniref:type IV pilus assembly protein FimV n=1 Tax=endosymbiont of unidentified scaly snail isolate Monju TaxID=1248727 RepID=UPI0003892702|nr:FimV/HubP family polar landmark protein [endosymbiont of unidentified scaly snail isolate Monju]BAN68463.1 hypothetical protein EBS_0498 [endosymbiont of unidentified scaly snail isolate Monju]